MSKSKEFLELYLNSEEGRSILTTINYTIKKSKTTKDDALLAKADDVAEIIAKKLNEMQSVNPTFKEAKAAILLLLKKAADMSGKTWAKKIVSLISVVF